MQKKNKCKNLILNRDKNRLFVFFGVIIISGLFLFSGNIDSAQAVDSETKLLLHNDGSHGSTVFTDSSSSSQAVRAYGNAQISTKKSKFGGASGGFDGKGDYLAVSTSDDFNFGSGDFTVDWWEYRTSNSSAGSSIARDSTSRYAPFLFGYNSGGTLRVYMTSGSSWNVANGKSLGTVSLNQWVHLAVVRSGNKFYAFKNGKLASAWTSSDNIAANNNPLSIGRYAGSDFKGYLDELRISKGVARWTTNFTPPNKAYDSASSYILAYGAGANGTIDGVTLQTVGYGSSGTAITAVADNNYHFVNWSDGSIENPRTDLDVQGNIAVTANFSLNTYALTYVANSGGTLSGTTYQTVNYGASGTAVTANPAVGYHFIGWNDGSIQNPRVDIEVTQNKNVEASFVINTYALAYAAGNYGSLAGSASQSVIHGSSGTEIVALPDSGYHFVNWSDGSIVNPRTDSIVTGDISITANFEKDSIICSLSYEAGIDGSVVGATLQTVNSGSSGTAVTAVPNANHHFVRWSDDSTQNPRTDMDVQKNINVTASFAIDTYTLNYDAGAGGIVEGISPQDVSHGSDASSVSAKPNIGYHFIGWSDGVTTASRKDMKIVSALAVTANFSINTYALNYLARENGSLIGATSQAVNHGDDGSSVLAVADESVVPGASYHFVRWSDESEQNPRTDINVSGDIDVEAIFYMEDRTVIDPTPEKINTEFKIGSISVQDGTSDHTSKATTNASIILKSDNTSLVIPPSTEITKTTGGTFDPTAITTKDIATIVRDNVDSSRAAVKIGVPNVPITFSQPVTVEMPVGSSYNGTVLTIYSRQDNGTDWTFETTCLVKNSICSFQTMHATEYTGNFEVSNSPTPTDVNVNINSTITIDCKDDETETNDFVNLSPIIGTGRSLLAQRNDVRCNIVTNNSSGYNLSFASSTPELINASNDTISAYTPAVTNIPESWSVSGANSEWGARLLSVSSTYDADIWGAVGTDSYSAKWYAVTNTNSFILANRATETLQAGDNQIVRFGAEIGASKFQPTGTYDSDVTFTALTN